MLLETVAVVLADIIAFAMLSSMFDDLAGCQEE